MAEETCTAIVAYEVNGEDREKFLNAWKKAQEHLQQQDGHIDTTLYQSASANPDFRYVNVATWASADDFRSATQSSAFREAAGQLEAYPIHASVYDNIEP